MKHLVGYFTASLSSSIFLILLLSACAIQPKKWVPPAMPTMEGIYKENNLLQTSERIDLKGWSGPEDIATDSLGNLYCGVHVSKTDFTDGRVLKITPEGEVSTFCNTESWVTGLHFDGTGNLIACDSKRGLISIDPHGELTVLADADENGRPFLIPNDVDISEDGMIYFSNTSSKYRFSTKNARKIILESTPDGGLYQYNPRTKSVTTLIDSSYFGNGVAVSQHGDFVLMADLTKYRVLKYHLEGTQKGKTELFLDNLPGFPNGISRRKDGSFWLGFTTIRNKALDKIHPSSFKKKIVFGLPRWMQPKQQAYGMFMHVNSEGKVLKTYFDPSGDYISEVSSIEEKDGYLYLGGDLINYIGKYKLNE